MDINGLPEKIPPITEPEIKTGADQCYHYDPEDLSSLATWQAMVQNGELTHDALEDLKMQPWFEMEVNEYEGEELDKAKDLPISPAKKREKC